MAVKMHQAVLGKRVGDDYTGPWEDWAVANGYASRPSDTDKSAAEIEAEPGAGRPPLDVPIDEHPMNPENRKDDGGNPSVSTAVNAGIPTVDVEDAQGDVPAIDAESVKPSPTTEDEGEPTVGARAIPAEVSGASQDDTGASTNVADESRADKVEDYDSDLSGQNT